MSSRRRGPRRRWQAVWGGLAASILLHAALALFMLTGEPDVRIPPPPETADRSREQRWENALRMVPLPPEAFPQRRPPAEAVTEPAPEAALPSAEPVPTGGAAPEAELPGAGLTNAERLRPRLGDERLWARAPIDSLAPALQERYERAETILRRLLKTYLDSLELSEEQERRARAWVFGEGDEKWGISAEGLHLGDVTIPIPFGQMLSRGGEARRQAEQVLRTWEMIQFQAGRIEAREVREERLEAIRERTRRRRSGDAGADSASADTTGEQEPDRSPR